MITQIRMTTAMITATIIAIRMVPNRFVLESAEEGSTSIVGQISVVVAVPNIIFDRPTLSSLELNVPSDIT